MTKFFFTLSIVILILLTAFIKNSTKRIDDEIFLTNESLRKYKKDFENIKLEYNFLSSTQKLNNLKNLYFSEELKKKDIKEIKIIHKKLNELEIDQLRFFNE